MKIICFHLVMGNIFLDGGHEKKLKKLNSSISPHWLRHAFCSLSIQNGCDIGTVSIAMGHSDLATTRAYCHAAEKPASEYLEECSI